MKRLTARILSLFMVSVFLTGCGKSDAPLAPSSSADSGKPAEKAGISGETSPPEGASGEKGEAVIIKIAHAGSNLEDDPQNVGAYYFEQIVEERSGGYYDVQVYPNKQLGDTTTLLEGIQMGTIEMGDIESGPTVGFLKAETLWDLPYLFTSWEQAHEVIDGEIGDRIARQWEDVGITILGYNDGGFRYFTNSVRPIVKPEDLKGLKIRVMDSEVMLKSINAFGASAVPMAFAEVYSALQQGAIDGEENPYNVIYTQAYYEVQKYLSRSAHFFYLRHYMINSDFYNAQPEDMKKLLKECALEACQVQRKACYEVQQKYEKDLVEVYGMEINDCDIDAFAEIARTKVWPEYYQVVGGGDAAAGQAILDEITAVGEKYNK